MKRHYTLPYHAGDIVTAKNDPRHVGRVESAFGVLVTIRWIETGWLSMLWARELQFAEKENA